VAERPDVREAGFCVVVNDGGIVAGRLRKKHLKDDDARPAEEVMEDGPTTVRYDEHLLELVARMKDRGVTNILVTSPEGRLFGVMYRKDAEDLLLRLHQQHHHHH
jgi:predicted transcriptional regulator